MAKASQVLRVCKRHGCSKPSAPHVRSGPPPVFCSPECRIQHNRWAVARSAFKTCEGCGARASKIEGVGCLECAARNVIRSGNKPPKWSEEEYGTLDGLYGRHAWTIQARLYDASGVLRTQQAIYQKANTRGLVAKDNADGVPIPEVARELGLSLGATHDMVRRNKLRSHRIGRFRYVLLEDFEALKARYGQPPEGWITIAQMADRLGIYRANCHKAAARGALPARKYGKAWYVDPRYVDAVERHWRSTGAYRPDWKAARTLVEGIEAFREASA
jgi:hypothetical protein